MSTGYGFEIAIRDILPGEQITDEYGLFNLTEPMNIACGKEGCRGTLMPSDFDHYYLDWDAKVSKSIQHLFDVAQPLYPVMDQKTIAEIEELKKRPASYKSVYALKHKLLKAA
jgi:hypothetical protein